MADEMFYRILFIVLYGLFFSIRGYYRFVKPRQRTTDAVEERKAFGKAEIAITVIILGFFGSVVLYILNLSWFAWSQIAYYPEALRWFGSAFALANIPLLAWIHRTLDRQYSPCLQIKESHSLIKEGPYAMVRHPMYTVLIGFSLGVALVTANYLIISFALLLIIPFPFVARKEEAMMLETFGQEYAEYMSQTGRFFPRLHFRQASND